MRDERAVSQVAWPPASAVQQAKAARAWPVGAQLPDGGNTNKPTHMAAHAHIQAGQTHDPASSSGDDAQPGTGVGKKLLPTSATSSSLL